MSNWVLQLKAFLSRNRWTVTLVMIGLLLVILILTINFWRTLLLCIVAGLCFFIGRLMDKGGWDLVKAFFDRVLPRR